MLILGRRDGEAVLFKTREGTIRVVVGINHGGRVRLAIDAPKSVRIVRAEIDNKEHGNAGGD